MIFLDKETNEEWEASFIGADIYRLRKVEPREEKENYWLAFGDNGQNNPDLYLVNEDYRFTLTQAKKVAEALELLMETINDSSMPTSDNLALDLKINQARQALNEEEKK